MARNMQTADKKDLDRIHGHGWKWSIHSGTFSELWHPQCHWLVMMIIMRMMTTIYSFTPV